MWDHTEAENLMFMSLSTLHNSCYNYITRLVSGNIYASIQLYSPKISDWSDWEDQSAEKTNNWKDKKLFNKQMGHKKIKYFIENRDYSQNTKYALLSLVEFVEIYALFGRTKRTKNLRREDQNGF